MSVDLGPIQRALQALHYTTPLDEQDERYVQRSDGLRQKLLNRILAPTTPRLLFSGPAGCGKSTELRCIAAELKDRYLVVLCPCDRDLDLHKLELHGLVRYLIWRTAAALREVGDTDLTKSMRDAIDAALRGDSASTTKMLSAIEEPRRVFSLRPKQLHIEGMFNAKEGWTDISDESLISTWTRLVREIRRSRGSVLFLIDGLEKVPDERFSALVPELIRTSTLSESQSVTVVPNWSLQGWAALSRSEQVEILDVPVIEEPGFIKDVILRRAPDVFTPEALEDIAALSAGIVRDALQIATNACRAAADAGVARVEKAHVEQARREMARTYEAIFSDNPADVREFLAHVTQTGHLPGQPALRDRLLSVGAVLRRADGSYCVHPLLQQGPLAQRGAA